MPLQQLPTAVCCNCALCNLQAVTLWRMMTWRMTWVCQPLLCLLCPPVAYCCAWHGRYLLRPACPARPLLREPASAAMLR